MRFDDFIKNENSETKILKEMIKRDTKKRNEKLNLNLSEEDRFKCRCNHRSIDGETYSLSQIDNDEVICDICESRFKIDVISLDEVARCAEKVINILETIKIMYPDMPNAIMQEYFYMIPLLRKLPDFYDLSTIHFRTRFAPEASCNSPFYKFKNYHHPDEIQQFKNKVGKYSEYETIPNPNAFEFPPMSEEKKEDKE